MMRRITFSDLSKRKNTISRSFSINSELVIYPPERKPPAVAEADSRGHRIGKLASGKQTAKNANDAADKQETDSQQEQGLTNNGGTHIADIGQRRSGHLAKGGEQSAHSRSLCSLKTFLLLQIFIEFIYLTEQP